VTRGGGGGSAVVSSSTVGTGGTGGGGSGTYRGVGVSGTANTGGGGGGGSANGITVFNGSTGGSGIVIIAYPDTYPDLSVGTGLTFTRSTATRSGYKVYSFTAGTGTVTFP
jgi:hypothetical protein